MDIEYREFSTKPELYWYIAEQLERIMDEADDLYSMLANTSALLKLEMPSTNWTGFYLMKGGKLVVGPFQGKPAVANIAVGAGVCGTAVAENKPQIVENVHACCNHIACDLSSASEIVVPIYKGGEIFGVIDIDSPRKANFDEEDLAGLQKVSEAIGRYLAR